jgi:hypothetical protein
MLGFWSNRVSMVVWSLLGRLPAVQAMVRYRAQQRELPGMSRSQPIIPTLERKGSEMER